MIGKRVTFTPSLPIKYTKRKKWILASCPIPDMHSQGETLEELEENLRNIYADLSSVAIPYVHRVGEFRVA